MQGEASRLPGREVLRVRVFAESGGRGAAGGGFSLKVHWTWKGRAGFGASCSTGRKRVAQDIKEVTCLTCRRNFIKHTERVMLAA